MNPAATNQSAPPQSEVEERNRSLEEFVKATLNILEDFNLEKARFKETQKAVLNIFEDLGDESLSLKETQRATLNLLEDFDTERKKAEATATLLNDEILERKQVDKNLKLKSLELERSNGELGSVNKELESFAYVVSHDLKAPLRGINSLAGWIVEDCRDRLDEKGKKQLGMLQTRVKKMHTLIDGVLEYSRIGRVKGDIEELNLNKIIPEIVELLGPPSHFEVEVEKNLPIIHGEKTRIHQLFQNFFSNAIKYNDKPQGQIKVKCEEDGAFWRFSVSDNGRGIDEKYHERIFGLFQTLDSTENAENTGIGLSLAKKIVEIYGGKIWVSSKLGEGSSFCFTYPKMLTEGRGGGIRRNQ